MADRNTTILFFEGCSHAEAWHQIATFEEHSWRKKKCLFQTSHHSVSDTNSSDCSKSHAWIWVSNILGTRDDKILTKTFPTSSTQQNTKKRLHISACKLSCFPFGRQYSKDTRWEGMTVAHTHLLQKGRKK